MRAFSVFAAFVLMASPVMAQSQESRQEPKPPAVTVVKAEKKALTEIVTATGSVVAREEVLILPEIEGLQVVDLLVEEGQKVTKGQVLARLSKDVTQSQLAQNEAALDRARAADNEARSALERARSLTRTGASSEAILDQRVAAAQSARAQIEELEARGRELKWRLSRTEIKAPVAGLVTRRTVRIGQIASASAEPMFRIVTNSEFDLDAEVTEQNLGRLAIGQEAKVILANDVVVGGKVRLIAPQVNAASRVGHVKIALAPDDRVKTGNFGRAEIITARKDGVAIPLSAVLFSRGETQVQVVDQGKILVRRVKTGLMDNGFIDILEGVSEGEQVVLRAGSFLRDGDRVRAMPLQENNTSPQGNSMPEQGSKG